ncbi:DUF5339 family protein [Achromobacter xylosoxidans]|nr:DUF5339 family protein [Achromobacter xylosoxidans]
MNDFVGPSASLALPAKPCGAGLWLKLAEALKQCGKMPESAKWTQVRDTRVYTGQLVVQGRLQKNQYQFKPVPEQAVPQAEFCIEGSPKRKQEREGAVMKIHRKAFYTLVLAASLAALAGCNKEDKAAAPAASAPAPAATTPAAPPPPATTPSTAAPAAGASASIPAECEAYIAKVNACMDKLGSGNPAAAAIKEQLDAARAQWGAVSDKTQLATQCKQSSDTFTQSASQMGCP